MPAIAKAQTIKQAKASYKSRGRPSLTEKEQRQLERALVLEQRADKAREAEKRRAEAAKKRAEQEKRSGKPSTGLGSQRTVDRFGYLASQFHLGAFFGKPKNQEAQAATISEPQDEDFEDEGLNDEELLKALADGPGRVATVETKQNQRDELQSAGMLLPARPHAPSTNSRLPAFGSLQDSESYSDRELADELNSFWEDLDSSTQIARELNKNGDDNTEATGIRVGSLDSTDFDDDLTAEDLDLLDPPKAVPVSVRRPVLVAAPKLLPVFQESAQNPVASIAKVGNSMPPPPRLFKATSVANESRPRQSRNTAISQHTSIRPEPALQRRKAAFCRPQVTAVQPTKPKNAIKGPFMSASSLYCSPELGFTLTQLEHFVDDDLQLTQASVG